MYAGPASSDPSPETALLSKRRGYAINPIIINAKIICFFPQNI
jgi:hypothetical protein